MEVQHSVTGIPLDHHEPRSRLGEGEDEEAFLRGYASTALAPRRIAELQGSLGAVPQRRAPPKARYLGKRKQRRRENSNLSEHPMTPADVNHSRRIQGLRTPGSRFFD